MRPFILVRHASAKSVHAQARCQRPSLKLIRSVGHWAFVSAPSDPDETCFIHFWHRRNLDPVLVARMLAHEIGHISGGGPDESLTADQEEDRADEFAKVTQSVIEFMIAESLIQIRTKR